MKILILNYEYPPIGGGGGVISKYIAENLASRKHDITVLSTWFHSLNELEEKSHLRVIRVKSKRQSSFKSNPWEMLSWIKVSKQVLDNMLETESFELTFANFVIPGGEVAYYLKCKYNIPYVILSHGHDIPWVRPYRKLALLHAFAYTRIKKIGLSSEINFIQSNEMKTNINRFLGPKSIDKNKLIPNGVDSTLFSPIQKKFKTLNIIFVGRLVAQKDPHTLLRAIKKFGKLNRNFSLSMYGDGPLRSGLERYVNANGLSSQVKFFGKVNQEQMVQAYKKANLMIAPSVSEGMSVSILEALSSGVFVIATRVSGNAQLITEGLNGGFMKMGSVPDLFEAINQYCQNRFNIRYEVPVEALSDFRNKFDWRVIVDQYEKEMEEVIVRKSS